MKKILLILILTAAVLPLFAATQMSLELGVQNTDLSLSYAGNSGNVKFNAKADLNASFIFDQKNGFDIIFAPDLTGNSFVIGGSYLYQTRVGDSTKMIFTAGPRISVKSASWALGADIMTSFRISLSQKIFLGVATGLEMYFAEFKDGKTTAYLDITVPLPKVTVGYLF